MRVWASDRARRLARPETITRLVAERVDKVQARCSEADEGCVQLTRDALRNELDWLTKLQTALAGEDPRN